jgi:predicted nucleotidyltransferase component of viral defense system
MKLYQEILPPATANALKKISKLDFMDQFYLAGGTSLAMQLGHRLSEDLDFFSQNNFDQDRIIREISKLGKFELFQNAKQAIDGSLDGVKISFLAYPYPLLTPIVQSSELKIAHFADIACMKLDAVSSRGTKRDFIDIYFLAQKKLKLVKMFELFQKKFKNVKHNLVHIKKSLTYFADAENEPMPRMLQEV